MKQILEKSACVGELHTHMWRAITCCLIMAMVMFGSFGIAKAQSISGSTQVQQNSTHYYTTDYFCDMMPYTISWGVSGGIIIQNQGINGVLVKWTSNSGQIYMNANSGCCNEYSPCSASLGIEIQVPNPPVTISGFVRNNCNTGVEGVNIAFTGTGSSSGQNFSVTTDYSGFYSVIVPYAYSSSIAASKSNYSFSPSQNFTNTTANRTLNFSVVQGNNGGSSLALAWDGNFITIVGMVPGFKYELFRTERINGNVSSYEVETPSITHMISRAEYSQVCIKLKCSTQAPICAN